MDRLTGKVLHVKHCRVPWTGYRRARYYGNVPEQQRIPVVYVLLASPDRNCSPNDDESGSNAGTDAVQVLVYRKYGRTPYSSR